MGIGSPREIAQALKGRLRGPERQGSLTAVSIDSRTMAPGALFFALQGEKQDGHDFLRQVADKGGLSIVRKNHPRIKDLDEKKDSWIELTDPLAALQELSAHHRRKFDIPLVAITGSSGKTTTKDMVVSVLSSQKCVHASQGNLNNEIGLPLTLLGLRKEHDLAVVEMGMRGLGQIRQLCQWARPNLGLITNIGTTHLEQLKTRENIFLAKTELLDALGPRDICLLNGEDEWTKKALEKCPARAYTFGLSKDHALYARDIDRSESGQSFWVCRNGRDDTCQEAFIPYPSKPFLLDALSALLVALCLGFSLEDAVRALSRIKTSDHRMKRLMTPQGVHIIDDSYNANPAAMRAALDVLFEQKGRKICLLGDMLELGPSEEEDHLAIGRYASRGADIVIGLGPLGKKIAQGAGERGHYCPDKKASLAYLKGLLKDKDQLLIKGSRAMKMEEVVAALMQETREKKDLKKE